MKNKKTKLLLGTAILAAMNVATAPVFATNPYNIEYTGGQELDENNVIINPSLLDELTPLIDMGKDDVEVIFSNSNLWQDGYSLDENCAKIKYLTITNSTDYSNLNDVYYVVSNRQYTVRVDINSIIKDDFTFNNDNEWMAVSVLLDNNAINKGTPKGSLETGFKVSKNDECTEVKENNIAFPVDSGRIFVDTKQRLYATSNLNEIFDSSVLYYGIMDIDGLQSFKILNATNKLMSNNMYAKNAEALQPTSGDLKNMYVEDGNYIYSQFDTNLSGDCNIFVKLNEATQNDGLDLVYGFGSYAGSPISYYAKQFNVEYRSDKNGTIKDIESENIIAGKTPSGSISTPKDGYLFDYWIADVDVTLTSGTTIKAGDPITSKQIEQVIVNEDIVFTAIHLEKEPIAVPDTGASTSEKNATLIVLSVIGVVLGTSILGIVAKTIRKIHRRSQF